ncbi:MAG: hypothetical protein FWD47_14045, partial [Treponema sp.]|nr:hypothetical protein [Treponema sp.]
MKKSLILILLFLFSFSNAVSDEPPLLMTEFISQNNQYKLIFTGRVNDINNYIDNWELININTNESIYNFIYNRHFISGQKVFISDDGQYIILINWFLGANPRTENLRDINNKIVIEFFYRGTEINRYKLSDVFGNTRRGIQSVSHFQWTRYNNDRNSIIMENNQIIIRTLESYE